MPLLFLPLTTAVLVCVVWGSIVISVLSFLLARAQGSNPLATVAEHLAIAAIVLVLSHFIGRWVAAAFT